MWSLKVPRRLKETSMRILEAKEQLMELHGHVPTVQEIAEYLEVSEEEILEALEGGRAYTTFSLDQEPDNKEEKESMPFEKYLLDEEEGYGQFETSGVFEKVMSGLSSTEKEIIKKRFLQEVTQREVAEALGISQMTVSRIEKAMKEKFHKEYLK
jgi:RNA polymerase sigma-B factor